MRKFLLPLLLTTAISSVAMADENPAQRPFSLGFGLGPTYGAGIVARYNWEKWGIQGSLLPYYTSESAMFVGGVTEFYTINRGKFGNLYASFGAAGQVRKSTQYDTVTDSNGMVKLENPHAIWEKSFAVGPGLGLQFNFWENFVFSFEVPTAFIFNVNGGVKLDSIRPYPNGAILYSF